MHGIAARWLRRSRRCCWRLRAAARARCSGSAPAASCAWSRSMSPTSYYLGAHGPQGFEYRLASAFARQLQVRLVMRAGAGCGGDARGAAPGPRRPGGGADQSRCRLARRRADDRHLRSDRRSWWCRAAASRSRTTSPSCGRPRIVVRRGQPAADAAASRSAATACRSCPGSRCRAIRPIRSSWSATAMPTTRSSMPTNSNSRSICIRSRSSPSRCRTRGRCSGWCAPTPGPGAGSEWILRSAPRLPASWRASTRDASTESQRLRLRGCASFPGRHRHATAGSCRPCSRKPRRAPDWTGGCWPRSATRNRNGRRRRPRPTARAAS